MPKYGEWDVGQRPTMVTKKVVFLVTKRKKKLHKTINWILYSKLKNFDRMYVIEPEVSGQLGSRTVMDITVHPPVVTNLHFVFYGWTGDDLIECFPVFLVSEKLKNAIELKGLTGCSLQECEIEKSDEFLNSQPNTDLPKFLWLKILGSQGDDLFIRRNKLAVSNTTMSLFKNFNLKSAIIETLT